MVRSFDRQIDLGANMTQMRDQLQQQLNTLMKAVTDLAEQTSAILLARHQTTINDMETTDYLSTQSASAFSQKSQSSGSQDK